MVEAAVAPTGPYRLRLVARSGLWSGALPGGRVVSAWQRTDGPVVIRAPDEAALEKARFMLAVDDDTTEFHERFARDPLIGASARALVGYRPTRRATVAHSVVRAFAGQLVESRRALAIERAICRACGDAVVTQDALRRLSALDLRRLGLAQHRATALARLAETIEFERLHGFSTEVVRRRLSRERSVGPWSIGVIAMEGLGRYDHGIVGDLSLVKLHSSLTGRWVETYETAELLAPYEEWQGLAAEILLLGWGRGLVPGASMDLARVARRRARRAA